MRLCGFAIYFSRRRLGHQLGYLSLHQRNSISRPITLQTLFGFIIRSEARQCISTLYRLTQSNFYSKSILIPVQSVSLHIYNLAYEFSRPLYIRKLASLSTSRSPRNHGLVSPVDFCPYVCVDSTMPHQWFLRGQKNRLVVWE